MKKFEEERMRRSRLNNVCYELGILSRTFRGLSNSITIAHFSFPTYFIDLYAELTSWIPHRIAPPYFSEMYKSRLIKRLLPDVRAKYSGWWWNSAWSERNVLPAGNKAIAKAIRPKVGTPPSRILINLMQRIAVPRSAIIR